MAKIGDRVRFLNAIGGGVIRKIDGKTAIVEDEDGFETPILLKDIVVVLPAGHEAAVKGSKIMFDQKAFDAGREMSKEVPTQVTTPTVTENIEVKQEKIEETPYGDTPNLVLAFEPDNIKNLSGARFAAVLVNDSNYFLDFIFLKRASDDRGWDMVFRGTVNPNELIDVAVISHQDLPDYEKIALQGIYYKDGKRFAILPPINIVKKPDVTKFHKLHCFRESKYFESPVLEFPLINSGEGVKTVEVNAGKPDEAQKVDRDKEFEKELAQKYKTEIASKDLKMRKNQEEIAGSNPHKLLPLIEVDLHIGELVDSLAGMTPKDMLELQLDTVRKTMASHSRRIGQKIVFIHGKGDGVLRKSVLELLKREYPKSDLQDASFREYGFGATLVTIR